MYTLQRTFNKVCRHLLKQNKKAKRGDTCVLRDSQGNKCAAGCLIPQKDYSKYGKLFEECSLVSGTVWSDFDEYLQEKGHDLRLVRELQNVHDDFHPNKWKSALNEVAKQFNLRVPV
jgi:hypothetical protein